jgi:dTDP-4-dehydrorhamnose reductase
MDDESSFVPHPGKLELWGGVECTVNRVGDAYSEQIMRSGHKGRLSDFDLFKALGMSAIRHGVLWEQTAPEGLDHADWGWADASLAKIRSVGMRPIVGLVHHGSGPPCTSLLDPGFPEKLATYAAGVAERYPWVADYTPVNEPLTTARFSGLYGLWYPHGRNDRTFVCALLNECRATVLAMRAIRRINPAARLIQTDDLGKTFSTPRLRYQAHFDNERRWLTYDLLCAKVDRQHFLWDYLRDAGASEQDLNWFLENPCAPDVIGVNHYLSGQRYLDENMQRYPVEAHGGNGKDAYADVLAARVLCNGAAEPGELLMEAWNRYKLPVAITECHNGCTREEQLRWFRDIWNGAEDARNRGASILAVTAWSLLGAFDWDLLVTCDNGNYEPGIFDIRSPQPRPTALAPFISELAAGKQPEHPLLKVPGWWRRSQRFTYGVCLDGSGSELPLPNDMTDIPNGVAPVLITGGRGTLARAFARICEVRGIPHRLVTRAECDISDVASVRMALNQHQPWAVVNAAGYVRVDDAEADRARCYRDNTRGAAILAAECARAGVELLTFSSDLVFSGELRRPYVESDSVDPLNRYGFSKAEAEKRVLELNSSALIVRTSAFFGPWDEYNFISVALRRLAAGRQVRAAKDVKVSPTYVPDLVNMSLDLLMDGESGIWNLANHGEVSWAELAHTAASAAGLPTATLEACHLQDLKLPARRPVYSVLASEKGSIMPRLEDAVRRFLRDCEVRWDAESIAA